MCSPSKSIVLGKKTKIAHRTNKKNNDRELFAATLFPPPQATRHSNRTFPSSSSTPKTQSKRTKERVSPTTRRRQFSTRGEWRRRSSRKIRSSVFCRFEFVVDPADLDTNILRLALNHRSSYALLSTTTKLGSLEFPLAELKKNASIHEQWLELDA